MLHVNNIGGQDKFLGLSAIIFHSKAQSFEAIKSKILSKVEGWKEHLLSQGGKEVLIKSIPAAISIFAMSYFRLLSSLCKSLNSILANFWWGQKDQERKNHWISWKNIFHSKAVGGPGFRDFELFNMALLAKQGWRIISKLTSLVARVLKGRYFPFTSFLTAKQGARPSWAWQSILWGRELLEKGLRWNFQDGKLILCKQDKWIPKSFPHYPQVKESSNPSILWVAQLVNWNTSTWNLDNLKANFEEEEISNIRSIPISLFSREDSLIWYFPNSGSYTVKSGYKVAC
ncbi:uncharacterized mitochondrial protein AtMg00310-like [Hevea brasiliensis]|uniref:uncharacterized mitochondrial protein AtMg00310-like n=1 Tax=Hevea brasiliensis TaxID=3981 RepID=UPI0025E65FD2|nr:uncharacterized mitochondrial protein AtMg00310-like [Hevea brasiliensis]